jgi:hypothetical protein
MVDLICGADPPFSRLRLGAFAGNNAGAVFTRGWDRIVELVGDRGKAYKKEINTVWIYPPRAERAAALASADPQRVTAL